MAHNTTGEIDSILWVDCEFTGLDPETDKLLQVAAVVTTPDFQEIADYNSFIYQPSHVLHPLMTRDSWWLERPEHMSYVAGAVASVGKITTVVDDEFSEFIRTSCSPDMKNTIYAGNSPHKDRCFIEANLPLTETLIGYRTLDVSSLKILAKHALGIEYPKNYSHDATQDIRESIAEAKFLLGAMCNDDVKQAFGL